MGEKGWAFTMMGDNQKKKGSKKKDFIDNFFK